MNETSAAVWRVGTIMNEPLAEVLRFVAWYLASGAQEVVICFDNPADPAIALLADHPRLTCVPCTAEFWESLGLTPQDAFVTRQNAALTWIYQRQPEGWLLNVDADEFLFFEGRTIGATLAMVPDDALSVRVVTAERLLAPDGLTESLFRRPMEYDTRKRVYGADAALFGPRRAGLVGHPQGKSAVRCGVPGLRLRQHWPRWGREDEPREQILDHRDGAHLLHMIGADFDVWRSKLAWRCGSRGFTTSLTAEIEAALAAADEGARLKELFDRLHRATPERVQRLEEAGALLRLNWDVDAVVAEVFGLSPEALAAL